VIVIPATIGSYTVTRLLTGSLRSFNQYYIYTYNTMTHLESYFSHYAEATVYSQFISRPSTYWTSSKITYRMNQSLSQFETMIDNLLD
jgi:hypothetical protein